MACGVLQDLEVWLVGAGLKPAPTSGFVHRRACGDWTWARPLVPTSAHVARPWARSSAA